MYEAVRQFFKHLASYIRDPDPGEDRSVHLAEMCFAMESLRPTRVVPVAPKDIVTAAASASRPNSWACLQTPVNAEIPAEIPAAFSADGGQPGYGDSPAGRGFGCQHSSSDR